MESAVVKETMVSCQTLHGLKLKAGLLHLTRHSVVFEVLDPACVMQTSEVLEDFKIVLRDRTIYSGRAVVSSLVNTGTMMVCEAALQDGWLDVQPIARGGERRLRGDFDEFLREWGRYFKLEPEYKVIVADMQAFLMDARAWLDQAEMQIRSAPEAGRAELEEAVIRELAGAVIPCVDALFEKFERIALSLEEEVRPAHRSYMRRQLHSLVLCAPFAARTYLKPLGYAGDYEMVGMIVRNGYEGGSLFAKLVNTWFLQQAPAAAHRNRIDYLKQRLVEEAARAARNGRKARILNLGCGPAWEVRRFLEESELSDHTHFTLLDFNEETIQQARAQLEPIKQRRGRQTVFQYEKKSVLQVLKDAVKAAAGKPEKQYEFVYCAGLFDYLTDRTCKQLMDVFYDYTAPGGLVISTNVEPANPMRSGMEHLLDWNLIYRTAAQMRAVKPRRAADEDVAVYADDTGVNVFMEVRKPKDV